jgi:hypothetical protein
VPASSKAKGVAVGTVTAPSLLKKTSLKNPIWFLLFTVVGLVIVLPVALLVRVATGLSASSDVVFGFEAAVAGLATDIAFRRILSRRLLLLSKPEIPFIYFWLLLCAYVVFVHPFEQRSMTATGGLMWPVFLATEEKVRKHKHMRYQLRRCLVAPLCRHRPLRVTYRAVTDL